MVSSSATGMVFEGLLLKLEELERLAAGDDSGRHALKRDECIEVIHEIAGPGRKRLADDAIENVRRALAKATPAQTA